VPQPIYNHYCLIALNSTGIKFGSVQYCILSRGGKNMAVQGPRGHQSLLSQVLKEYRKEHGLTQEQLAADLHVEPRTLRAWENERPTNNINELRRIADLLGIKPERLGIATAIYVPRTSEQIEEVIAHIWDLVEESRLQEAITTIKQLAYTLESQIVSEDPVLLRGLARTYHAAGYVTSEATRASESPKAIAYYKEMEKIARILDDHTLLNIALTYQGDMYRRLGNISKAVEYLEAARDTTPKADAAARGNGLQLLGRAYLRLFGKSKLDDFKRAMEAAEGLAHTFDPRTSSTQGHYSLGTVYEEYGRSYTELGQMQRALEYLDLADANLPATKFWKLLVMISRAIVLIKDGELQEGSKLAIEAAKQSQEAGIGRYLERLYNVQEYLDEEEDYYIRKQREIRQIGVSLREALGKGNKEI
jgi:transcriptional regulator with XRE-family HTH domain